MRVIQQGLSCTIPMPHRKKICRGKERRNTMRNNRSLDRASKMARIMAGLGCLGAVVTILMRVWLSPSQLDMDTGLFGTNLPVIGLMLVVLLLLGCGVFVTRGGFRQEITGKPLLVLAIVLLAVGGVIGLYGVAEILARLGVLTLSTVSATVAGTAVNATALLQWLQSIFCLLSGVALVRLGLSLASEGATRRGVSQWGMLAPVLWIWLVLANYEMSYASMVRLTDGFFTLATYIMEMLFLFFFARYIAGVGQVGFATLLFFSAGATLFAVSAPVVRLILYLLQDIEALGATGAAGPMDLAIGLLALTVSVTLCQSLSSAGAQKSREEEEEEWFSAEATVELIEGFEETGEE